MQDTKNSFTPASYVKILSFLHLGILATPLILAVFFYFQIQDTHLSFSNSDDIFLAIVPIIAVGSIFLSDFLFRKMVKNISNAMGLKEKLARFQTACIISYALIEGAALFSIVIFYNTQNFAYLFIGLFLLFYLYLKKPTKDKIEHQLNLQGAQKAQFNRLNEPIN
ncbi:hypothetical protein J0X14_10330 [Muricauda sp. CAU 1633]|uniref:hypothetical protein n=1 Tax=Allomuricauda sp. CAU 1633 TaxID=2816036 RepID=UPI001A8C7D01|nr:hypothetical protein [Muricauda sp. CAU 1633]MBO0322693.1 hypothetical protein [Muricauda sp. CAU 1633]